MSTSTFLGWLSYPLYCLHLPILTAFLILEKICQHSLHAIDYRALAMGVTLGVAAATAFAADRLELQRKLTAILAGRFLRGMQAKAPAVIAGSPNRRDIRSQASFAERTS